MSLGKLSWQFAAGIKSYSIIFYHTSAHVRSSVVSTQQEPLQTVPVPNVSLVNTRLHCNQMCRAPLCLSVNAAKGQQVSADLCLVWKVSASSKEKKDAIQLFFMLARKAIMVMWVRDEILD